MFVFLVYIIIGVKVNVFQDLYSVEKQLRLSKHFKSVQQAGSYYQNGVKIETLDQHILFQQNVYPPL